MTTETLGIEIDRLTKRYGDKTAADDLTLQIAPGELFCFVGPNGAGKTTTMQTVVGHKNPTSGDVRINGVSVGSRAIHRVRRRMGYLGEQPTLYEYLTGREFLQFIAELYELSHDRLDWIDDQLEQFELSGDADTLLRTYSMGMKKKIAFLGAALPEPDILLLDEPTGALDAASARLVKDFMLEARDAGRLVFFSTHVMEIAERLADRIAIIHHGRLIAEGTLDELRRRLSRTRAESLEDIFLRVTDDSTGESNGRVPRALSGRLGGR